MINLVGTPPSSSDLMLTAPLNHHCTEEIPQLTLQALLTRSSLSSFLLPSHSAVSTHDQLAMALRNQVIELRGSSGSSLESPPQAWLSIGASLKWASMRLQTGSASLPTAALKPTDLPLPSAPMPSGHQSPQDLGDDLYLCVYMNQEHTTITSCAILTGHTHKHQLSIASQWIKSSSLSRIDDELRLLLVNLKHHSNSRQDKTQALGPKLDWSSSLISNVTSYAIDRNNSSQSSYLCKLSILQTLSMIWSGFNTKYLGNQPCLNRNHRHPSMCST